MARRPSSNKEPEARSWLLDEGSEADIGGLSRRRNVLVLITKACSRQRSVWRYNEAKEREVVQGGSAYIQPRKTDFQGADLDLGGTLGGK